MLTISNTIESKYEANRAVYLEQIWEILLDLTKCGQNKQLAKQKLKIRYKEDKQLNNINLLSFNHFFRANYRLMNGPRSLEENHRILKYGIYKEFAAELGKIMLGPHGPRNC